MFLKFIYKYNEITKMLVCNLLERDYNNFFKFLRTSL